MDENNNNAAAAGTSPPPENFSDEVEEQEESGWTDYLEDYFSSENNQRKSNSLYCSSIGSCSWDDHNISNSDHPKNNDIINILSPNFSSSVGEVILDIVPKKLINFKKSRTQKIFHDDSLEDTATSPIQTPRVSTL